MRRRWRSSRGLTLVELMIASFLAFLVVLAMGRIIQANLRAWEWGRDKAVLQANATEAIEWMARQVRAAHHVAVVSTNEFQTFDSDGTLLHTYRRQVVSGEGRLQQDGTDLVDRAARPSSCPRHRHGERDLGAGIGGRGRQPCASHDTATVRNRSFVF